MKDVCKKPRNPILVKAASSISNSDSVEVKLVFNPQAPVTQKTADEVVFRRFQGEGVEFF